MQSTAQITSSDNLRFNIYLYINDAVKVAINLDIHSIHHRLSEFYLTI